MRLAARANLGYVERAIVWPMARRHGVSPWGLNRDLMARDYQYLLAVTCIEAAEEVQDMLPRGVHREASLLGGSMGSFAFAGMVVAKYYSLGARFDAQGRISEVANRAGLGFMLRSAHRRLRHGIIRARSLGITPVIPIFHLRVADELAADQNDLSARIVALSEYWLGTTFARLMNILGGGREPSFW